MEDRRYELCSMKYTREWSAPIPRDMQMMIDDARRIRDLERQVQEIMAMSDILYIQEGARSIKLYVKRFCVERGLDTREYQAAWERQRVEAFAHALHVFGVTWPPPDDLTL